MAEKLRLALLGGLQVTRGDVPVTGFVSTKLQALPCYPAIAGRPHLRRVLVALLWGEMPEASANTNLRRALSSLRRLVGDDLTIIPRAVASNWETPYSLDVETFTPQSEDTLRRDHDPHSYREGDGQSARCGAGLQLLGRPDLGSGKLRPHNRVARLASELKAQLPPQIRSVVNEQGKVRTLEEVLQPFLARRPATSLRKGE
jgi:hypothetical protein